MRGPTARRGSGRRSSCHQRAYVHARRFRDQDRRLVDRRIPLSRRVTNQSRCRYLALPATTSASSASTPCGPASTGLTSISATRSARSATMTEKRAKASASAVTSAGGGRACRRAAGAAPGCRSGAAPHRHRRAPARRAIAQELDQHAAGADHDDRAELRIELGAEGELDASRLRHRRDQHPGPSRRARSS